MSVHWMSATTFCFTRHHALLCTCQCSVMIFFLFAFSLYYYDVLFKDLYILAFYCCSECTIIPFQDFPGFMLISCIICIYRIFVELSLLSFALRALFGRISLFILVSFDMMHYMQISFRCTDLLYKYFTRYDIDL